jgi:hypothetical protein
MYKSLDSDQGKRESLQVLYGYEMWCLDFYRKSV